MFSKSLYVPCRRDARGTVVRPMALTSALSQRPLLLVSLVQDSLASLTDPELETPYPYRALHLAASVINEVLYEEVREKRGLVYSISFTTSESLVFDAGWATISFSPHPGKIDETIRVVKAVFRECLGKGFDAEQVERARGPTLATLHSATHTNSYWMQLLKNLQNPLIPRKTIEAIHTITPYLESVTAPQISHAAKQYWGHFDTCLVTVVGQSGPSAVNVAQFTLAGLAGAAVIAAVAPRRLKFKAAAAVAAAGVAVDAVRFLLRSRSSPPQPTLDSPTAMPMEEDDDSNPGGPDDERLDDVPRTASTDLE
eukprot:m.142755 g.142755  ORF g.142755 m.142755 type:complete len:312 (-) comp17146_c1_seq4:133-1068(-)